MIIGSKTVDISKLDKLCFDMDKLNDYILSLIPAEFRHNKQIVANQRYYVAIYFRRYTKHNWEVKNTTVHYLLQNTKICGYPDDFIECSLLYSVVNIKLLREWLGVEQ